MDELIEQTIGELSNMAYDPAEFINRIRNFYCMEIESEIMSIDDRKRELVALKHRLKV